MNLKKVKQAINVYKTHFDTISHDEIYKWQAIKCFQDHWNQEADDYSNMLGLSLQKAGNLLASQNYFPKRMIMYISQVAPQAVKELFCILFDEELDLINRLVKFQNGIAEISETHFPKRNHYQDYRAILVYLTMRFPDRYFFFKFSMFKTFANDLEYPFVPSRGNIYNITQYITFCNLLKAEIVKDKELLLMHNSRLTSREYIDNSLNILTQDIVFSVTRFRNDFVHIDYDSDILNKLNLMTKQLKPGLNETKLKGSFTNYLQNEQERKRIGTLGELLVLRYEEEKLMDWKIKKKPEHISVTKGDGLGYDILSYDKCGKPIYIEVKTTTGNFDTTFFVTKNELECSIRNSDCYFLYRLFNYEPLINYADFVMRKGNLSDLCINPLIYQV